MDLQEIYKKESGYDVGRYNIDNTNYYSEDYVEWLEKQLRIGGVSRSLLPSISIDKVPIYLKDLFDYMRSKKIKIDDEEIIKKLLLEYEKEQYLSRSNDR